MKFLSFLLPFCVALVACGGSDGTSPKATGDQLELLTLLQKRVAQHPDSASVRMQLVNALDSLRMYPEAIAQTDSMIRRDSLNNGLWFARGQLLESNKDTAGAIASFEKALAIYPSIETQLNLANLYAEKKDSRSLALCQNVSRMGLGRETDAGCDFIAGVYHARTGNNEKALAFFDRAINNNYTLMEAYMEKGFVYFTTSKLPDALKTFETAITVNNTYADAYYWRAKIQEAMGQKDEALLNYQRALGLDKQMKEAREAIKRLD